MIITGTDGRNIALMMGVVETKALVAALRVLLTDADMVQHLIEKATTDLNQTTGCEVPFTYTLDTIAAFASIIGRTTDAFVMQVPVATMPPATDKVQ